MFREFQKLQENRRKISLLTKPRIRKLYRTSTWVCRDPASLATGFGPTPTAAYNDWKYMVQFTC